MLNPRNPSVVSGPTPPIKAVLFDMGGVLVSLGALEELLGLASEATEGFWNAWLSSDAVRSYERGVIDTADFADRLVSEFTLTLSPDEFIERFVRFPRGLFPGAAQMVASVSSEITTGILSNTNELHWENQSDANQIQTMCQRDYLSYRLRLVKPDRDLFEYVVADLGLPPEQILFIDDNQINVDGARAAGLRSEVARGVAAATGVLHRYKVTRQQNPR